MGTKILLSLSLRLYFRYAKRDIEEPEKPPLLHGDFGHGNVMLDGDRVSALIDPDLFFGDAEFDFAPRLKKKPDTEILSVLSYSS